MESWHGRIDDEADPETFRWHQIVRPMERHATPGIALLGFASDEGVRRNNGRTGAAQGPSALRLALANLPVTHSRPLYDAGDIACTDGDLESAQQRYADRLTELLSDGHFPVGMGGGHEIAFASYLGLANNRDAGRIAIVNLDAHFDLRDSPIATSGTPFRQAIQHADKHGIALDYFCLGVSSASNTRRLFHTARETDTRFLMDEEMTLANSCAQVERLLQWLQPADSIYLTICLDVLPHAAAPGVSAPNARGITQEVLEPLIAATLSTGRVKVCDIAELCPPLDRDNITARVAARLIHGLAQ
ncbi:formimidoylglutamase [Novilysobacter spongiicola]|uniref:Formimidoylglutamase n=1 Tax=Lysobacter spongiicola DSM 21749 TaxID=1122188 RepID=A0A1T4M4C6_9GAMM|nr:formimidoylglutamase [Lysobacter spongiicola]SJZ61771.1 formiminoglutamase [Lysobacter spongiicola DSM 21749]